MQPPHAPPTISNDTPKIDGIPTYSRMSFDGRVFEVSYANNVTIIERNNLLHR